MTTLSLFVTSCGPAVKQPHPSVSPVPPPAWSADQEYRIGIGDQLDIKFFYNPDLNEQVTVRPDGRISLQLIPEIVVSDLTPAALTKLLTEGYSKDLRQPQVTVIVRGFGSQRVYVDGEVARPGMIPILGLMTALEAISQAGGMKDSARQREVLIIRRGAENKPLAFSVDLKNARDGTDLGQNVSLAPYDIIYVPRSRVANVNLWVDQYLRKNVPIPISIGYYPFH
jgi:protein involved in polysaccharide export with SLBB domain